MHDFAPGSSLRNFGCFLLRWSRIADSQKNPRGQLDCDNLSDLSDFLSKACIDLNIFQLLVTS